MHISNLKVQNYKCFLEPEELLFGKGINIIVGPNNVGKTALLEVLNLNFQNTPHINASGENVNKTSSVEVTLCMGKNELKDIIRQTKYRIEIPFPENIAKDYKPNEGIKIPLTKHFEEWLDCEEEIYIKIKIESGQVQKNKRLMFDLYNPPQSEKSKTFAVTVRWQNSGSFTSTIGHRGNRLNSKDSDSEGEDLNEYIINILRNKIYFASATRLSKDRDKLAPKPAWQKDGANLTQILASMQNNLDRTEFELFNQIANYLFPQIKRVSVETLDNNELQIQLWTITDNTKLKHCALPISKCGTGFATTLPLITFMVTEDEKFLLIDEPQAFLHPGAMRKLVEKLNLYPQHQYFIATHSPTVINAAKSPTIVQLKQEDGQTIGESLSKDSFHDLREALESIGAKLSDVFGADNVLWVEGQTEEKCFPEIVEKICGLSLANTKILPLKATGDLGKDNVEQVLYIYKQVSGGYTLCPRSLGILIDSENTTEKAKEDLRRSGNAQGLPIKFLKRRLFENYLLHPKAIATVANSYNNKKESGEEEIRKSITDDDVNQRLEQMRNNKDCIKNLATDLPTDLKNRLTKKDQELSYEEWLKYVHGKEVLKAIFKGLCGNGFDYRETVHSYQLTKWIIDNDPEKLEGIAKGLEYFLKESETQKWDKLIEYE